MRKYEEEHYLLDNIIENIYPWVKTELTDKTALNGKHISEKNTPVIAFVGDLKVIFAIKRGENKYEILKDNMLPPETDVIQLFHKACSNLVRDVDFVIGNTWYGACAIIADGFHEASSVLFKHIWQFCSEKLEDDLVILVPANDTVLFCPSRRQKMIADLLDHGEKAYQAAGDPISQMVYYYSRENSELTVYKK